MVESLPKDRVSNVLGNQLLRAGTSVGANYRSASRAKSPADFISKMGIVEEEADECVYWMDLLEASGRLTAKQVQTTVQEAGELTAISVASIRTARRTAAEAKSSSSRASIPHSTLRTPRFQ